MKQIPLTQKLLVASVFLLYASVDFLGGEQEMVAEERNKYGYPVVPHRDVATDAAAARARNQIVERCVQCEQEERAALMVKLINGWEPRK